MRGIAPHERITGQVRAPGGPRLYLDAPLKAEAEIELSREASNNLIAVMRLGEGAELKVFNGRDGEWRAEIAVAHKRSSRLRALELLRPPAPPPDLGCSSRRSKRRERTLSSKRRPSWVVDAFCQSRPGAPNPNA